MEALNCENNRYFQPVRPAMGFCGQSPLQAPAYLSPCQVYPVAAVLLFLVAAVVNVLWFNKLRALARLRRPAEQPASAATLRCVAFLALLASHAAALTQAALVRAAYPYIIVFHALAATAWLVSLVRHQHPHDTALTNTCK